MLLEFRSFPIEILTKAGVDHPARDDARGHFRPMMTRPRYLPSSLRLANAFRAPVRVWFLGAPFYPKPVRSEPTRGLLPDGLYG